MSIENKLTRLATARDNIRIALNEKGIDASEHGFEDFAEDIGDIEEGENLSDVDTMAFGDNPTLPNEGKTNPANYEAIANAINAARARPNAVTLESLNVTENGTYTAPSGKAYSPVTVSVESQGQNYVETITGTLGTIFNNIDFDMFVEQLSNNDITAYLAADSASTGGAPLVGYVHGSDVFFGGGIASQFNTEDNYMLVATVVFAGGNFATGLNEIYSPQYSDYTFAGLVANVNATLTIIHHPMSDSGT